jgi:hypothetical protein
MDLAEHSRVDGGRVTFTADLHFVDGKRQAISTDPIYFARQGNQVEFSNAPNIRVEHIHDERLAELFADKPELALDIPASEHVADTEVEMNVAPAGSGLVTRTLCFKVQLAWADGAVGDYYDTTSEYDWTARGNYLWIPAAGVAQPLDSSGCYTGPFFPGYYDSYLLSYGIVNGHTIAAHEAGFIKYVAAPQINISFGGPTTIERTVVPTGSAVGPMAGYQAAAFSLLKLPGLNTGVLEIETGLTTGSEFEDLSEGAGGKISLNVNDHDKEFVIAHETGHYVMWNSINESESPLLHGDGVETGNSPCHSGADEHRLRSVEEINTAFVEGFAYFYSANVFVDPNGPDCTIDYAGEVFNCLEGDMDIPEPWMESRCSMDKGTGNWAGLGVDADWIRQFWDVHAQGPNRPSMNSILTWLKSANDLVDWSDINTFTLLHWSSGVAGGSIWTNWNNNYAINGIAH